MLRGSRHFAGMFELTHAHHAVRPDRHTAPRNPDNSHWATTTLDMTHDEIMAWMAELHRRADARLAVGSSVPAGPLVQAPRVLALPYSRRISRTGVEFRARSSPIAQKSTGPCAFEIVNGAARKER
jgi:hypothetical protein